ncbi:3-dehydroquinate synthase [Lacipirellula limnantheis]|uniref:3-dehydroquinate synthase n=1 Tax=Lacipirellula limnantheis TaxID=2528024 RepID=A0A517U6A6_9BACT|nr:3-dehydroquinate synthase [Lacipirellula limnantheis]QDT76110.1 3-dehydroquinate synthase [Lacipirellula limnantheis]
MAGKTETVRVALAERSYDIEIGSGTLAGMPEFLRARTKSDHAILVTDSNVDDLYADAAGDQLVGEGWEVDLFAIEAGEPSKSVDAADELWNAMLNEGADRESIVVAIGGGVVGDLAGFVAATFARGLEFFQAPTTLLAQVDSSVGGKVGVNLPGAKNMIGAFWQPRGVLCDVAALESLPDREYRAGLAEVVKYGVILDAEFFAYLEANVEPINARHADVLTRIVERSCRLKANVVEQDERETTGLRAALNYGHTFGHAFEAIGEYEELLHGEAVAAGMRCAMQLAVRLGRVAEADFERQESLLEALGLLVDPLEADGDEVLRLMYRDKKVAAGKLRFVLPDRIGHVELVADVPEADVLAALAV